MNNVIHSHCQTDPLKEVWIGGVYPSHFYQHLGSKAHDLFSQISEITQSDFCRLRKTIEKFGITVVEPKFDQVDHYLDHDDRLLKPPISPCDLALTLSNRLYVKNEYPSKIQPYQHAIDRYQNNHQDVVIIDRESDDPWAWVEFASVVRAGRDLYIDHLKNNSSKQAIYKVANELKEHYRIHISDTGDHSDGIFCPVKPGNIVATHYRKNYKNTFPDWEVFQLNPPMPTNFKNLRTWEKWWLPGIDYGHFNQMIIDNAESWLGNPHETVFDVNILVIDNHNIVCGAYNEKAFKYFESIGITPHLVEIKSRYFWDAGIHCLTSDIHRTGELVDFWPDRGNNGIYTINEW